jgi:uncharacterized repeat protein (TIGR02543 family)
MKKILLFIGILFCAFVLVSCSASKPNSDSDPSSPPGDDYGSIDGPTKEDFDSPSNSAPSGEASKGDVQAGQITASAWSDNENFEYWLNLITHSSNNVDQDKHYLASTFDAFNSKAPGLEVKNMYKVAITSNGVALNNAKVTVRLNSETLFQGVTNAAGIVYIFIKEIYDTNISFDITYNNQTITKTLETLPISKEINLEVSDFVVSNIHILDLALVIDTTGSMGDELNYLKVELQNVLETISKNNVNLEIRLALIFYRDEGDQYVTRTFNFTNDLSSQYNNIKNQKAFGGGDTPEAVHSALNELENLSWSDNSTKIAIHVCDAPPHAGTNYLISVAKSTKVLAQKGVRVIPVICSGSDELTELVFRQLALYTGGTYTYVTDHSGIGNSHTDQATPSDVVVEYLNKMLIRLITEYLNGTDIPPVAYNANDKHTVSFDSNGGSKINIQIVENNGLLTKFENPTKEGYVFCGWVIKGTDKTFRFDMPITSSLTLEAVWIDEDVSFEPGNDIYHLITFNTNTDQKYNPQLVLTNGLVNQPADPSKEGHTFLGWYTYEDGILTLFDFNQRVTNNIELYAIFVKNE